MKKKYVFHCPVQEIWVMEVEAENEGEAWSKVENNEWYQTSSFSGTTKSGQTELAEVREKEPEPKKRK